jgi:hypothetical protein
MQNSKELLANVASLESKVDMLEAELSYINQLLYSCGFPEGIVTLKATVEELLAEEAKEGIPKRQASPFEGL